MDEAEYLLQKLKFYLEEMALHGFSLSPAKEILTNPVSILLMWTAKHDP